MVHCLKVINMLDMCECIYKDRHFIFNNEGFCRDEVLRTVETSSLSALQNIFVQ